MLPKGRRRQLLHGRWHGGPHRRGLPERLGAVATLHDGALATGDATGPRRLGAKTRGSYHFAIATDDEKPQAKD